MSKKILSLALAVIMLFSICAVAASAVQGDGTENIRIYMTSDATVGAAAGTVVNVSYYVDLPDGIDELQMCVGNIAIGYNSEAYAVNSTGTTTANDARTWGDDFAQYMKSTANVTVSSTISTNILKKFSDADTAKGWDKALQVQMTYDGTNSSASYGFPIYDNQHIFTLSFVAQRTLTADDVIGVVEGAYSSSFFKVCWYNGTSTAQVYPVEQVDMTDAVAVAPSAPSYDVYKLADSRKHLADDSTYTTASFFAFNSIAPDFNDAGTSQFITAITATVTATSGETSITVTPDAIKYVYDLGSGEYGFRVICKGLPADAEVSIVPAVTTTDGATYNVETVSFNVADLTAY